MIYPVALILDGKTCLVVGAGKVGARKVKGLLECGARVKLVAPIVTEELRAQLSERMVLLERMFQPDDVVSASLVFACTNSPSVNSSVCAAAHEQGIWCNRTDSGSESDFLNMGVVRRGDLSIAVSTGGASPAASKWLCQQLEQLFGPEYADLLVLLSELRAEFSHGVDETRFWRRALSSEALGKIRAGDFDAARESLRDAVQGL